MTYRKDGPKSGGRIQKQRWKKSLLDKRTNSPLERYIAHRREEEKSINRAMRATRVAAPSE